MNALLAFLGWYGVLLVLGVGMLIGYCIGYSHIMRVNRRRRRR